MTTRASGPGFLWLPILGDHAPADGAQGNQSGGGYRRRTVMEPAVGFDLMRSRLRGQNTRFYWRFKHNGICRHLPEITLLVSTLVSTCSVLRTDTNRQPPNPGESNPGLRPIREGCSAGRNDFGQWTVVGLFEWRPAALRPCQG